MSLDQVVQTRGSGASSSGFDSFHFGTPKTIASKPAHRPKNKFNKTALAMAGIMATVPAIPAQVRNAQDAPLDLSETYYINEVASQPEPGEVQLSLASQLAEIKNKIEKTVFTHRAVVSEITVNKAGSPDAVLLIASIDGKEVVLRRPYQSFSFDVADGDSVLVDGVIRNGIKKLKFRKASPITLDDEQISLIDKIVSRLSPA